MFLLKWSYTNYEAYRELSATSLGGRKESGDSERKGIWSHLKPTYFASKIFLPLLKKSYKKI
jgi:hypothetical protein